MRSAFLRYLALAVFFVWFGSLVLPISFADEIPAQKSKKLDALFFEAVSEGDMALVKMRLDQGAVLDARNQKGFTPLHIALRKDYSDIAQLLILKGADVNASTKSGLTPLHMVQDKATADLLIKHGANVNASDFENGMTPLFTQKADIALSLIRAGADLSHRSAHGNTPLMWHTYREYPEGVRLLLSEGAAVNEGAGQTRTALHIACRWDRAELVRILLEHGADINARDGQGWTPLHHAVFKKANAAVSLLGEYGADVNARTKEDYEGVPRGATALDIAKLANDSKMVITLKAQGGLSSDEWRNAKNLSARMESTQPATWSDIMSAILLVSENYRSRVLSALQQAGDNAGELVKAIYGVAPEQREGLAFLLANMPERDLTSLSADFLIESVDLSYQAQHAVQWGASIPQDIFYNYVLPYASVNERRDRWRPDFFRRFLLMAQDAGSIRKAVRLLNERAFEILNVSYDAEKRPKPDQSPHESMYASYSSCTGLSILLVDILRSVSIPARVVTTPEWVNGNGNHTWVEVWDQGEWHFIGAAEPSPYNDTWFKEIASQANPHAWRHRIYAASFERTGNTMPLIWDESVDYVSAIDVTRRYIHQR